MLGRRSFLLFVVILAMAPGVGALRAAADGAFEVSTVEPGVLHRLLVTTEIDTGDLPVGFVDVTIRSLDDGTPTASPTPPGDPLTTELAEHLVGVATFGIEADERRQATPLPIPGEVSFALNLHQLSFFVFDDVAAATSLLEATLEPKDGNASTAVERTLDGSPPSFSPPNPRRHRMTASWPSSSSESATSSSSHSFT